MKGVILAGGNGTRLFPLTKSVNKHLLPIYDKPMIYYPLQTLLDAGITEILVVTSGEHAGTIFKHLGSGKDFGVHFTYRVQDTAGGLPHAIALAENFVGNEKFVSINGDNILSDSIRPHVDAFNQGNEDARVLLFETTLDEAKKMGVAVLDGEKVTKLIEKPAIPPSNWASIGVYFFKPGVFDIIRTLKPSQRGELEITDIHNTYIQRGTLAASKINGEWLDAGSFDELARANKIVKEWKKE
ncbi:MAG: sugar nucleotidyltransferase [archaeon]